MNDIPNDPKYSTQESRLENREVLSGLFKEKIGDMSSSEFMDKLEKAGVPTEQLGDSTGRLAHLADI